MTEGFEERQKLRKKVEKRLLALEEGERIKPHKDLLEKLLFESIRLRGSESSPEFINAKFLVWSGEFLRKLDLSEVSFEDVVWDVNEKGVFEGKMDDMGRKLYRKEYYKQFGVERIVLSGTNANIDFKKSYVYKVSSRTKHPSVSISGCDFSGIDLSQNIIEGDIYYCIGNSNFDNTKLKVSNKKNKIGTAAPNLKFTFRNSSFVNCDFSEIECNAYELMPTNMQNYYITSNGYFGCNLCNTGLRIILPKPNDECVELIKKYAHRLEECGISNPYSLYRVPGYFHLKTYNSRNLDAIRSLLDVLDQSDLALSQEITDICFSIEFGTAFWVLKNTLREKYRQDINLKDEFNEVDSFVSEDRFIPSIVSYVQALEAGLLYGCYVNGIKILTPTERELKRVKLAQEHGRNESDPDLNAIDAEIEAAKKRRF